MYIVIEIQSYDTGDIAYLTTKETSLENAYHKYHTVLAAAAISGLPYHSCVILDQLGSTVARDYFSHGQHKTEE